MLGWQILSIVVACLVLFVVLEMMRRRKLREKYAGVWLVLALGVVVLAVIPQAASFMAKITGVQTPSNFVFLLAGVVLALVSLHLSTEVGHLEEEVRTSVEEIALLRCELEDGKRALEARIAELEARTSAPDNVNGLPEVSHARVR
ncbi:MULTISPECIES: DUF2304 domain-containing protein [Amycolatopsis]|uniref:DUF2304 domain-containing protein n=2 Tax=Amycolatopsis TaxID=1813 RepID=A0A2A9FE69_9PSEU|nr:MULTISPECIES: DUF2304 domain-containing protein [Amycolatopsis]PFG48715.1 hypothetical protein ATK36_3821 [Amycolatopsis sulphurea]RJQ85813.1 DUF2304 domain-containing protein [Amycolatopsis panacis]